MASTTTLPPTTGADAGASPTPDPRPAALEAALKDLAKQTDGTLAVTVVHVRSLARASVNGDARLPMMSVFKLPITLVTLAAIEKKEHAMDEKIPISAAEIRSQYSPIADAWKKGEKAPTLETLLRLVIQDSDNTAGDKLVTLNGGGPAITTKLQAMGLDGIDVAEQEIEIFARMMCPGIAAPKGGWTEKALGACKKPKADAEIAAAKHEIEASRNAATSDALANLLVRLQTSQLPIEPSTRTWLLGTLEGTKTGSKRLKGELPEGTKVAHKTGTGDTVGDLNVATNDVGIVTLPNGDPLVIAVMLSGATGTTETREATIAKAAKLAWDAFAK
jgi:beta-lactamase class A